MTFSIYFNETSAFVANLLTQFEQASPEERKEFLSHFAQHLSFGDRCILRDGLQKASLQLDDLPDECIYNIISFSPFFQAIEMSRCCKRWKRLFWDGPLVHWFINKTLRLSAQAVQDIFHIPYEEFNVVTEEHASNDWSLYLNGRKDMVDLVCASAIAREIRRNNLSATLNNFLSSQRYSHDLVQHVPTFIIWFKWDSGLNRTFSLNFIPEDNSIVQNMFHYNPRSYERPIVIVHNSKIHGDWISEIRPTFFPIEIGTELEFRVIVDSACFRVYLNGALVSTYPHRREYLNWLHAQLEGKDHLNMIFQIFAQYPIPIMGAWYGELPLPQVL